MIQDEKESYSYLYLEKLIILVGTIFILEQVDGGNPPYLIITPTKSSKCKVNVILSTILKLHTIIIVEKPKKTDLKFCFCISQKLYKHRR